MSDGSVVDEDEGDAAAADDDAAATDSACAVASDERSERYDVDDTATAAAADAAYNELRDAVLKKRLLCRAWRLPLLLVLDVEKLAARTAATTTRGVDVVVVDDDKRVATATAPRGGWRRPVATARRCNIAT